MIRVRSRHVATALGLVAWFAMWPAPARADAPSATNFLTTITGIEPATTKIEATIIGGDSFLELRVAPGTVVEITGYWGEPWIRFLATGEVRENQASQSHAVSQSRSGSDPDADVADTPVAESWRTVAHHGRYAWHDHRTHWMGGAPPPGLQPGDVVVDAVVPITVDGSPTSIFVVSTWQNGPSPITAWLGFGVGAAAGITAWSRRRSVATVVALSAPLALAATLIGAWQFVSVPPQTGPPLVSVVLPAVAALALATAFVARRRAPDVSAGLLALAGLELVVWCWTRRHHVDSAILPTDAPFWLDRAVTCSVAALAVALIAISVAYFVERVRTTPAAGSYGAGLSASDTM